MHPHLYYEAAAGHRLDLQEEAGRHRRLSRRARKAEATRVHRDGRPGGTPPGRT
jgi:uncharacterized ParB-like nuclease family protein